MSLDHNFFSCSEHQKLSSTFEKKQTIGGCDNDAGFYAIAGRIIEMLSRHPLLKLPEGLLDKLLTRYETFFSAPLHEGRPDTYAARIQQLIKSTPAQQFHAQLTFILRQLAVDELCSHPERYLTAFIGEHAGITTEKMRRSDAWIDASNIAALSNTLGLPIIVNVVESDKPLPKQHQYNIDKSNIYPCVTIKLHRQDFSPMRPFQRGEISYNRGMSEISNRIIDEQIRIKHKFESIRPHLEALDKNDLLSIYIKWMNHADNEDEKNVYAGTEHGYQQFFEPIIGNQEMMPTNHQEYIKNQLVIAIARAVSVGHMHLDVVYTDNQSQSEPRP